MRKIFAWIRKLFMRKVSKEELALQIEAAKKVIERGGPCPGLSGCSNNHCPALAYRKGMNHPWDIPFIDYNDYADVKVAWFKDWLKEHEKE